MTRRKWTTDEQEVWLEQRKATYIEVNQKKTAAKDFFPVVTKEFHEKWPMSPVTPQEVNDAGSVELATRAKQRKYDKRISGWFPNNTRTAPSAGILKIKPKTQPRMLQPWQAYHALTYKSWWKTEVNMAWSAYKNAWAAEHPAEEKPQKNRFQIMVEFMREKFKMETDEMKDRCEEYRKTRQLEATSPEPEKPDLARNAKLQEAITMLPHTLATIGESLMKQTGWNVSILMGGPTPENDRVVMSYLSHTGKTKAGQTFEKFLGNKDYDQKILLPFEAFLHASFSAEDCAARSLMKTESTEGDNRETQAEEWEKSKEEGGASASGDDNLNATGKSQYEKDKEQNIKEIKEKLAELDAQYPLPEEFAKKQLPKAPAVKKRNEAQNETAVRRQSQRGKDKIAASTVSHEVTLMSTQPAPITVEAPEAASDAAAHPTPTAVLVDTQAAIEKSSPAAGVTIQDVDSSPSHADLKTTASIPATNSTPIYDTPEAVQAMPPITNTGLASSDVVMSDSHGVAQKPQNDEPATSASISGKQPSQEKVNDDVVMTSPPSMVQKPQNDENMPPWLIPMIKYLHGVATDVAWQNLVTEFVEFEKGGPPTGNLPTKCRPQEVSDWIRSKKKDVVPAVKPAQFSKRFMEWWTVIQPHWRKDEVGSLVFFHDIPMGETWQGMRKGGTAGIYVVVMALSWWIKAQEAERDIEAWATVDDFLWVIEQLNKKAGSSTPVPRKRVRNESSDGEDKGQRKARRHS